jgi:hypothetical protein
MISNFQSIVLKIAIVIFIICMIFIGTILYQNKYSAVYPPVGSECPDYWLNREDKDAPTSGVDPQPKELCYNVKNLGNASCNKEMDFTTDYWQGTQGDCRKLEWARKCDLTWDGITNNDTIKCD